jgi:AhpD family alkylhydroperoxidase
MARLPYADHNRPEVKAVTDRIVEQRGSVLHLYQMLLHSGPLAEGWLAFLTAVRQKFSLSGALRELVIIRVAILNGAQYEADQHVPFALKEGVTQAQIDALKDWKASPLFDEKQKAVLALTDAMTRDIHFPDAVFDAVKKQMSERETVELCATVAAYNMVSRFLEALQIHSTDKR